ncbi:hypothetical protein DO97_14860 [Neosynechococcus sphagnicola sy1]|uniref:Uncharacterized protein n=1 Tax=Neosynechococcus sphagnicola sy1 TaxID=1497020 RepID=A0A098TGW4_9CYAN|nr:lysylphosphatidylglycerol synthase domain-containing protein [Neosynechococcus sphagnicola]KGF71830.1 hypothetical protein DO97_14860 [Neosynechococcus sphagnicola sy1]
MKQLWISLKPYLRWAILGGTLFFVAKVLKDNWQEVAATRLDPGGWIFLIAALVVTLAAHTWAGCVWGWILRDLYQSVRTPWAIRVYLKTNIAKYLPGNVWHYYGRIAAAKTIGISLSTAALSVLLEPLLMAAAALLLILVGSQQSWTKMQGVLHGLSIVGVVGLVSGLVVIHPRVLNPLMRFWSRLKAKATHGFPADASTSYIRCYPLKPLMGELVFLSLRGAGFFCTLLAFSVIQPSQVILVLTTFSLAWFLGLVLPGAPGGIGVFEAAAIALLDKSFSPGIVLTTVALYRLLSILAETLGAGLVCLEERYLMHPVD